LAALAELASISAKPYDRFRLSSTGRISSSNTSTYPCTASGDRWAYRSVIRVSEWPSQVAPIGPAEHQVAFKVPGLLERFHQAGGHRDDAEQVRFRGRQLSAVEAAADMDLLLGEVEVGGVGGVGNAYAGLPFRGRTRSQCTPNSRTETTSRMAWVINF